MIQTQMDKAMQQFGGMMDEKPIDKTALPGSDTGSMFSQGNWVSFQRIYTSNMAYLRKYWKEYEIKVKDICDQYIEKVGEENKAWNEEWEKLQEEHKSVQWSSRHDGPVDEPCRRSVIQHKRRLNGISDMYYNQWENLFFPDYPQRMKPTLEGFFRICMLYVRNMSDPKVMQREWQKVIESFAMYAEKAVTAIGTGGGFTYHPEVEEEEQELERDIALAREEAVAKGSGFISAWPPPEKGYTEWVDEHFVLDVAAKYLALRITTRDIEFKAAVPGVFSGAKYDFEKDKLSTYTGLGMKLEVGVNVCGVGLGKLQVGGEAYRRTATWDFKNGTYSETESAKAEAAYKAGPLQLAGEFQLDSQLHAKVKGKASMNVSDDNKFFSGGPTAQWEQDLW